MTLTLFCHKKSVEKKERENERGRKSPPGLALSVAATARYRELPRPDGQLEAERELSS